MCTYVLLIEDDAIASHEWYEKVNEALNLIEHNNKMRNGFVLNYLVALDSMTFLLIGQLC